MADYKIRYKKEGDGLCVKSIKICKPCVVEIPNMVKDKFVTGLCPDAVGGRDIIGYVLPASFELPPDAGKERAAVVLPESLKTIGRNAFAFSELKKVVLPSGIKEIGDGAFSECRSLEYVKLNDGLRAIGFGAFEYTSIKEIAIPESVEQVDCSAFFNCSRLEKITADGNRIYTVVGNCLINTKNGSVIAAGGDCTIPTDESVCKIDDMSFGGKKFTALDIPKNIKYIGDNAFAECDRLESVVIRGATFIDDYAFVSCSALAEVTLPSCLETLGVAFEDCESLATINYGGTRAQWKSLTADDPLPNKKVVIHCSDGDITY